MPVGRPKHKDTIHGGPTQAMMTLEEVADFLRVHPTTVYRLCYKKRIPAFKVGAEWRFLRSEFMRWIRDKEVTR